MTQTKTKTQPETNGENRITDPKKELDERAKACSDAIADVLEKHNCTIKVEPVLDVAPVGQSGDQALIRATYRYGVVAHPKADTD